MAIVIERFLEPGDVNSPGDMMPAALDRICVGVKAEEGEFDCGGETDCGAASASVGAGKTAAFLEAEDFASADLGRLKTQK